MFTFGFLLNPAIAFASVQITEVMYDVPGSDTGREWIEITNIGNAPVDTAGFKLFQGGVNHGVAVVSGTSTLTVGESAIIADNTQKFLLDYPAYKGSLFRSSFSLTNASGALVLKDSKLTMLDSVSYVSTMGAAGDGNSLHCISDVCIVSAPNPGSVAATQPIIKASAPALAAKITPTKSAAKNTPKNSASKSSAAAVQVLPQTPPLLPTLPQTDIVLWSSICGVVALILLGVAGFLYVKPPLARAETSPSADEFEIE